MRNKQAIVRKKVTRPVTRNRKYWALKQQDRRKKRLAEQS